MPNYRRSRIPGASYFFTVVTHDRMPVLTDPLAQAVLASASRDCRDRWPYRTDALVVLPDHLHAIWTLPEGDADFARRWAFIKRRFTVAWLAEGGREGPVTRSGQERRRRGVWQQRYWEHLLGDGDEFVRHVDYCYYNPVKHEHVSCPLEWPFSTFHRDVRKGLYEPHWGSAPVEFPAEMERTARE